MRWLILGLAGVLAVHAQAPAPPRKALLLGNSTYQALGPAPTAAADLQLVDASLKSLGFATTKVQNFKLAELQAAIKQFIAGVSDGDEVFVYFAGAGIHSGGDNYLLASDFDVKKKSGHSLTRLIQDLEDRNAAVKILFVDAARGGEAAGEAAGFIAPVEQTRETLIVFSQQYEQTLRDEPAAKNSPFARALADALQKPGLSVSGLAEDVIIATSNATRGQQSPVMAMLKLTRTSYLRPPVVVERVVERPVVVVRQAELEPGATRELKKTGMPYSWVPAGDFEMGCVPDDSNCQPQEKPRHRVRISRGFWITKTEVTAKSYQDFARATGSPMPEPTRSNKDWLLRANPVTRVSWDSAGAYCKWAGGRLPTEAEWEYAGRGGKPGTIYPGANVMDHDAANFFGKDKDKTKRDQWEDFTSAPVGSFDANAWGLLDMAGNVREWVLDWFDAAAYSGNATDPAGPANAAEKVVRGGDFNSRPASLRLSSRESHKPSESDNRTGFRCVIVDWPSK